MVAGFGDRIGGDRFGFAALTADLQSSATCTGDAGVAFPLVTGAWGLLEVIRRSDVDRVHLPRWARTSVGEHGKLRIIRRTLCSG